MAPKRKQTRLNSTPTILDGINAPKESTITTIHEFLTVIGLQGYATNITVDHQFCSLEQFHNLITCDDDILKLDIYPLAHRISILQGLRKLKKTKSGIFSLPQQEVYQHLPVLVPSKLRYPSSDASDRNYDDLPFLTPLSDGVVSSQPNESWPVMAMCCDDAITDVDVSVHLLKYKGMSGNKLNDVFLSHLRKLCQWYDTKVNDIENMISSVPHRDRLGETKERPQIQGVEDANSSALSKYLPESCCNGNTIKADLAPVNIYYRVNVTPVCFKGESRSLEICEKDMTMNICEEKSNAICFVKHDGSGKSFGESDHNVERSREDFLEIKDDGSKFVDNVTISIAPEFTTCEEIVTEPEDSIMESINAVVQKDTSRKHSLSLHKAESEYSSHSNTTGSNVVHRSVSLSSYEGIRGPHPNTRVTLCPDDIRADLQENACIDPFLHTVDPTSEFHVQQSNLKILLEGTSTDGETISEFYRDKETLSQEEYSCFPYSVEDVRNITPHTLLKYCWESGMAKFNVPSVQYLSCRMSDANTQCCNQSIGRGKGEDMCSGLSCSAASSSRILLSPTSLPSGEQQYYKKIHNNTVKHHDNCKETRRDELEQLAYAAMELRQISIQTRFMREIAPYTLVRAARWKKKNIEETPIDLKNKVSGIGLGSTSLQRNLELLPHSDREQVRKRIKVEEKKEEIKNAIAGFAADAMQFYEVCPGGVNLLDPEEARAMGVYQTTNAPLFETALLRDAVSLSDALDTVRNQFCVFGETNISEASPQSSNTTAVNEVKETYPGIQHLTGSKLEALFKSGGTPIVPEKGRMKRTSFLSNKWASRRFGARRNMN